MGVVSVELRLTTSWWAQSRISCEITVACWLSSLCTSRSSTIPTLILRKGGGGGIREWGKTRRGIGGGGEENRHHNLLHNLTPPSPHLSPCTRTNQREASGLCTAVDSVPRG